MSQIKPTYVLESVADFLHEEKDLQRSFVKYVVICNKDFCGIVHGAVLDDAHAHMGIGGGQDIGSVVAAVHQAVVHSGREAALIGSHRRCTAHRRHQDRMELRPRIVVLRLWMPSRGFRANCTKSYLSAAVSNPGCPFLIDQSISCFSSLVKELLGLGISFGLGVIGCNGCCGFGCGCSGFGCSGFGCSGCTGSIGGFGFGSTGVCGFGFR